MNQAYKQLTKNLYSLPLQLAQLQSIHFLKRLQNIPPFYAILVGNSLKAVVKKLKIEDIYKNLPVLETNRLLRKLSIDDAEAMHKYGSNGEVTKHVFWDTHKSLADTKAFIHYALNQYDNNAIAPWGIEHKQEKKLIGTIDFVRWLPEHRLAEIGYVITPEHWGKGIATEAANCIRFSPYESSPNRGKVL